MTTEITVPQSPAVPSASAPAVAQAQDAAQNAFAAHKPKRTLGLKLFDDFAYGGFLNTTVFAASVVMTYWTKHGNTFGREGSLGRAVGNWFHNRSKPINEMWGKLGVKNEKFRTDLTSVLWSFADGTLFSLLAKPLENRREKIAMKIDDALGTTPENMKAYEAEPKQSWGSILGGRLLTFSIVFPTAWTMSRIGGNERVFLAPGRKFAETVEKALPRVSKWLERQTIKSPQQKGDFFGYVFFEAFYTSVCTGGLYFFSRLFARHHPAPEKPLPAVRAGNTRADEAPEMSQDMPVNETTMTQAPSASITRPTLVERVVAAPHTAELTA